MAATERDCLRREALQRDFAQNFVHLYGSRVLTMQSVGRLVWERGRFQAFCLSRQTPQKRTKKYTEVLMTEKVNTLVVSHITDKNTSA